MAFWLELIRIVNLPYTTVFGLMLLYWFSVVLGIFDVDLFDFDVDEIGFGDELLGALNLGKVPFSLWLTIFSGQMTVYSLLFNKLIDALFGTVANPVRFLVCFVVFAPIAAIVTKISTSPMEKLFDVETVSRKDFVGQECRVTSPEVNEHSGVGEILVTGIPSILYIRAKAEEGLKKNDRAVIYEYNEEKDLFYVTRVEGLD